MYRNKFEKLIVKNVANIDLPQIRNKNNIAKRRSARKAQLSVWDKPDKNIGLGAEVREEREGVGDGILVTWRPWDVGQHGKFFFKFSRDVAQSEEAI